MSIYGRYVKLHLDYLGEKESLEYRQACLDRSGVPGEFLYPTEQIWNEAAQKYFHSFVDKATIFGPCKHNHDELKCKCREPVISIGQDESGFALNSMGKKRWIIKGKMPLLPKTEGNTLMVSMLINSFTGAGLKMLPSEIEEANVILRTMGLEEIKEEVGIQIFELGANKEGYWNAATFQNQIKKYQICLALRYPTYQLVLEVDWSAGHMKDGENALGLQKINSKFGGKSRQMRDSILEDAECLGDYADYIEDGKTVTYIRKYNVGDTQSSTFQPGDSAPYYAPDTPMYDRAFTDQERADYDRKISNSDKAKQKRAETRIVAFSKKHTSLSREEVIATLATQDSVNATNKANKAAIKSAKKALDALRVVGLNQPRTAVPMEVGDTGLADGEGDNLDDEDENENDDPQSERQLNARGFRKGYMGCQKGVLQMVYERGFFRPGMVFKQTPATKLKHEKEGTTPDWKMYANEVLANCPDYRKEKKELEDLWEKEGHILVPSVKGHPELAGEGVEYAWGFTKRYYRKHNDRIPTHQMANVIASLSQLKLSNIWAFGRRTRDLMRAYIHLEKEVCTEELTGGLSFNLIEDCRRMMKTYRTHRNIFDQEGKWLKAEEARIAVGTALVSSSTPVDLESELPQRIPVVLSHGVLLLIENEEETFIAGRAHAEISMPMLIAPLVAHVEKIIRVQGVHVHDGGPCLWYSTFYTKYGREPTFHEFEKFKDMCVTLADIYRDSPIFNLDGTAICHLDSGHHLTLKQFLEWKMENVMFPVRAVTGRDTGMLVVHDMSTYGYNDQQDWHHVTFDELLVLMRHPCNSYPFVDIIGRLIATVLRHIFLAKQLIVDPSILFVITDVTSLVVNRGGRDIFEPFQLKEWTAENPKDSFQFPFIFSTLMYPRYGCIVQSNNNHFDPVEIREDITSLRALVNYEEVVEHENLRFVAPDREEEIGHDSMNLDEPVLEATQETIDLDSPMLTMASTAVGGIFRGLIGGPIMLGELLVEVGETMTTIINSDNVLNARLSPEEKRRRVKPSRFVSNA